MVLTPHIQVMHRMHISPALAVGLRVTILVTLNALIMATLASANMPSPNYEWHMLMTTTNTQQR
jgi:hypothetical protein